MAHFRISTYLPFILVLSSSVTALSLPAHDVFQRGSTCSNSASTQCPGVPSGFCCGASSSCLVLANNTTLLCCPKGQDCALIQPITCDVTQQNVSLHPQAALLTTNLTATLQSCGSGTCCPLGYSCNGGNSCVINQNQGSSPSHTSAITATSTPTAVPILPSSSTTPNAPAATTAASSSSNFTSIDAQCNAFPATAVVAGFFPGLFAGILIAVAGFCLLGAHQRKQDRLSGSFGKVSASISDPIYQEPSIRTDFIRKQNSPSITPSRQPTIQRVRSLFQRSAAAGNGTEMGERASPPAPPVPRAAPITPRLQREPSGESINIFADPSTAREGSRGRDSHQTTFTDMMERADLGKVGRGEPFVPPLVPRLSPKSYNSPPRGVRTNR